MELKTYFQKQVRLLQAVSITENLWESRCWGTKWFIKYLFRYERQL